jgi:hypothetical protein
MASKLRHDVFNIINSDRSTYGSAAAYIQSYHNILDNISKMFPSSNIIKNLPKLSYNYSSSDSSLFIELYSATGQVVSFLEGVLDDPDEKIKRLSDEINQIKEENLKLEELNKITSESLNRFIHAEEFPISEKILSKIPKDIAPTLHDAFSAYGAGSYTACVCVCRNIIQGLVQEQCAKESIRENGLDKQIKSLISIKKIKQRHNQTLLDTVATLGHRSAHPTSEVFTKEKASLVLNGLMILIDEVFT